MPARTPALEDSAYVPIMCDARVGDLTLLHSGRLAFRLLSLYHFIFFESTRNILMLKRCVRVKAVSKRSDMFLADHSSCRRYWKRTRLIR